jgi:hypothetical protein
MLYINILLAIWLIGILPAYLVIKKEVLLLPQEHTFGGYATVMILAIIWPCLALSITAIKWCKFFE